MKVIASQNEVLPFVRDWMELLEQERYEEAMSLLLQPPSNILTPEFLRALIENFGQLEARRDGRKFRVTPWKSAVLPEGRKSHDEDVEWFDGIPHLQDNDSVGDVHFDVPLNGEWSDLTAVFWIRSVEGGFALELERVEVL